MIINDEKKIRDKLFNSNKNIFLTGPAGTGKTTLIKEFVENTPNVVVCASTGVAAVNAGGETAHRLFSIPIPAYGASLSKVTPSKLKTLVSADVVVFDEISMCRNDVFSFAARVLKKAEKIKGSKIRLVVVGDYGQLPPVVPKEEAKLLKKFGYHESGYAFTTKEWASFNFVVCEMNDVKRQSNEEFIKHLHEVRNCDDACLSYFNSFLTDEIPQDAIQICGTNAEAERINREYLDSLPGTPVAYQSVKTGRVEKSIADDILLFKEGARVYFTTNDTKRGAYANGTFGTILTCEKEHIDVELANGGIIRVTPHTFSVYTYKIENGVLVKKEVGSVSQMPLKIARAVTIHKSQGKTFDKACITPQIFAPGQLYVALSRIRTPEGLSLTSPVDESALQSDPIVSAFVSNEYKFDISTLPKAQIKETKIVTKKTPAKKSTTQKKNKTKPKSTRPPVKKKMETTVKKKPASKTRKNIKAVANKRK